MNKILKSLRLIYYKLIPFFIRQKLNKLELLITYWYSPFLRIRVSQSAMDDCFEACKRVIILNKKNNYYTGHLLHKMFNKYHVRSDLICNSWWEDFFKLTTISESSKFQQINKSLIDRIEKSNFNSLEHYEILHIYSLSLRFSLFELGFHLRQKSLKIALAYPVFFKEKNEIWKLKAKLSALLETRDFLKFDQLIPLLENRWKKEKYLLNYLRNVLSNEYSLKSQNLDKDFKKKDDIDLKNFLENKKIAIVSPALVDKKDGNIIDNSDVVIRTNHYSKNLKSDFIIKGSKSDIIYVNGEQAEHIIKFGVKGWSSSVSWVICKLTHHKELMLKKLLLDKIRIGKLKLRIFTAVEPALFNGALNALPNILIDLSSFNPKEILLYHFDVMITKERIKGYYLDNLKKISLNEEKLTNVRLRGFAVHDPVTQFIILKSFWKRGFIKGDFYFNNIIKLTTKDYMKKLQKTYLKHK